MVIRNFIRIRKSLILLLTILCPSLVPHAPTNPTQLFAAGKGLHGFDGGLSPSIEIHIAPDGDNLNGDGSESHPYATIARAIQEALPGTALRLHPGTYPGGTFISGLSGTPAAPIWIGGIPGEARPVISGGGEGLHLSRVSYLILHDLEVRGSAFNGINMDDGGGPPYDPEATHHVVFRNLSIHSIGTGGNEDCLKLSGVSDFWILDSDFSSCGGNLSGSGIDQVGCHRGLIAGNHLQYLSGSGIQVKGGSEDIEIRGNHFVDAGARAVNIGGSTGLQFFRPQPSTSEPNYESKNIRVIANLFEGSTTPLAFVGTVNSLALNNTIIQPENWLFRILQETTSTEDFTFLPCGDNAVINNIFYFERSGISTHINIGPDTDSGSFAFSNNLWYAWDNPSASEPSLPAPENQPIAGQNPSFVNAASGDYRLSPTSPAIAAGLGHPMLTFDFHQHPFFYPPDIGAFAFWQGISQVFLPAVISPKNNR